MSVKHAQPIVNLVPVPLAVILVNLVISTQLATVKMFATLHAHNAKMEATIISAQLVKINLVISCSQLPKIN
jgi:hypothetical protein